MFSSIIDSNHKGWEIELLEYSGVCAEKWPAGKSFPLVKTYAAKNLKSGITMNTNSLDGIKRMIEMRNIQLRRR